MKPLIPPDAIFTRHSWNRSIALLNQGPEVPVHRHHVPSSRNSFNFTQTIMDKCSGSCRGIFGHLVWGQCPLCHTCQESHTHAQVYDFFILCLLSPPFMVRIFRDMDLARRIRGRSEFGFWDDAMCTSSWQYCLMYLTVVHTLYKGLCGSYPILKMLCIRFDLKHLNLLSYQIKLTVFNLVIWNIQITNIPNNHLASCESQLLVNMKYRDNVFQSDL